ncbi:MAG: pyrroline-5-carboxylate reductase family protein [Mycoplasmatales bacterium]
MNIGIIGVGNMGGSILDGLINSDQVLNQNIYIYNRTIDKIKHYQEDNVNVCNDVEELIKNTNIIILGIKPYQYKEWLDQYASLIQDKMLVVIAAGISTTFLSKYTQLFSICMPNMGSSLGKGYTVICRNNLVSKEISSILIEESSKIFKNLGLIRIIEEEELSTVISIAGSSPAYFLNIIDQMSNVFVDKGYDKKEIEQILSYVMEMSANLIQNKNDKTSTELTNSICSPNGSTIEAVKVLNDSDLKDIFEKAINNCANRATDMKKENEETLS